MQKVLWEVIHVPNPFVAKFSFVFRVMCQTLNTDIVPKMNTDIKPKLLLRLNLLIISLKLEKSLDLILEFQHDMMRFSSAIFF